MTAFDIEAFRDRFRLRAAAVQERGIPPLEGSARRKFIEQAELDYTDFSLVAAAEPSVEGDHLVLRIPLASED